MKIFNLNAYEWDRTEGREGWRFKDAWVGAHTDAELIGASVYEVEPGNKQGPFHTHHANEEWAIVLRGEPTLRTHEGEQQLRQGDVVAFPRGKEGAHQIRNDTDAPVRVLMFSTLIAGHRRVPRHRQDRRAERRRRADHLRSPGARARILGGRGLARRQRPLAWASVPELTPERWSAGRGYVSGESSLRESVHSCPPVSQ